jgi:hypothetical protein
MLTVTAVRDPNVLKRFPEYALSVTSKNEPMLFGRLTKKDIKTLSDKEAARLFPTLTMWQRSKVRGAALFDIVSDDTIVVHDTIFGKMQDAWAKVRHGTIKPHIVCPWCRRAGKVATHRVHAKVGYSAAKGVAAIMTQGVSLLFTGISKKKWVTMAKCFGCETEWKMCED